jgi:uncharacterized membrane protein YfcA
MAKVVVLSLIILLVAITMTMVGRGGGNFYVLILVLSGIPMHQAATTGQFILFAAALAGMLIFQKNKVIAWPLVFLIGILVAFAALAGGYFSHRFSGFTLKIVFSCMLAVAGFLMLIPVSESKTGVEKRFGYWRYTSGNEIHSVNLWIALPVIVATGFGAGMVGVSGGSFLVPLMVLACSVPMHMAVGTASTLIAVTALMGFIGHALKGDFNPAWAIPLALVTVIGGIIGGKCALRTRPKYLKQLFAYTNMAAALVMIFNAYYSR